MPKITRTISSEVKLNTVAVSPQNTDQTTDAMPNTLRAPMRSDI
ncbi:MAG TPA: hypothetical protein VGF36_18675 [Rhodopila sp.]